MKLISLTYSPNGNIAGYQAQIVIDPQPDVFKAVYLHIVQDMAGEISIAAEPHGMRNSQRDQALDFARRIIAQMAMLPEPVQVESMPLWILHISHSHGDEYSLHRTADDARQVLYAYCLNHWDDALSEQYGTPDQLTCDDCIDAYFSAWQDALDCESYMLEPCGQDSLLYTNDVPDASEEHRRMLKARVCEMIDGMVEALDLTDIAEALYQASGYQPFPWHMEDIRSAWADKYGAEIEDCPLSDAACMDILERMKRDHDASIGINWEVIYEYLEEEAAS